MPVKSHILVVTTAFSPHIGGAEVAVQEYMKRLKGDFDFTVVTARLNAQLPSRDLWNGIPVIRVGWGMPIDKIWLIFACPLHAFRLQRAAQGRTLVWAIMASYAGAGAWLTNLIFRIPYVLTLQEGDNLKTIERRLGLLMPLFKNLFRRARSVQVIAPFLAEWAIAMNRTSKPVVIPNGVSYEQFTIAPERRVEWRHAIRSTLFIPPHAPVVCTVSRLVEKNGLADLIDAVRDMPDCHAIIIGEGKLEHELKQRAHDIRDRVHFIGAKDAAEIVRYGAASDVFCRASITEGFGNVFLEAMCMELPVVASDVGGIPTIITHSVNGLLVRPHAPIALRGALTELLRNRERARRFVEAGKETANQFRWEHLAIKLGAWLRSNVDTHR